MGINLLDILSKQLGSSVIDQASQYLGENAGSTQTAMGAVLPALLGTVVNGATTNEGAKGIMNMLTEGNHDGSILSNLGGLFGGGASTSGLLDAGNGIVRQLLGDKAGAIAEMIAKFSGIKGSSATSLMSMAAPLLMGTIGKQVKDNGLGISGLMNLLSGQSSFIKAAMPAGLSGISNLLGFSDFGDIKGKTVSMASNAGANIETPKGGGGSWLPWLIGVAALIGLVWFLMKGCNNEVTDAVDTATEVVGNAVDSTGAAIADAGNAVADGLDSLGNKIADAMSIDLPGGVKLSFPKASLEDSLMLCINDPKFVVDKAKWLNFDRLLFDSGKATLQASSQEQLKNLAAILTAFPKVNIKIGAYTDSDGDDKMNLKLSDQRAKNVMAELVKLGIGANRLEAEGYGESHPVCPANDTEACKQQNRRVAVSVRAK